MKSVVKSTSQNLKSQYNNGFPFPKEDMYGQCNMFNSAHFMMDDNSKCTQNVDLKADCENLLNPEFYSSKLMYYLGQQGKFSEVKDVEIEAVFTYDDVKMQYGELLATADVASKFSENNGDCSCA